MVFDAFAEQAVKQLVIINWSAELDRIWPMAREQSVIRQTSGPPAGAVDGPISRSNHWWAVRDSNPRLSRCKRDA
ncbi:MAG: hypothetical protein WD830_02565, partial [Chloroflexota bacterium]